MTSLIFPISLARVVPSSTYVLTFEDNSSITLIELKTGKNEYESHSNQLEIYGELYLKDNNQLVETSKSWTISPLPKTTNQELTLWFEYNSWIPKEKYVVRGVIVAGGVPIAYRLSDDFDIKSSGGGVAPLRLETVLLVGVVVAFVGYFIYIQRGKQKIKVLLNEKH